MRALANLAAVGLVIGTALLPVTASAEDNTGEREAAVQRPAATIADMAWLEGEWAGTGIGGRPAGETFTFAGANQMVGHFWQLNAEGGIDFYELITVVPDGESLTMRLKHFTSDLTGWEEKEGDAALEFPLRSRGENQWVFGPVTFTRPHENALNVSVTVRQSNGSLGSFDFSYERVSS